MNRFLSKKKAEDSRNGSVASTSSDKSRKWKKGKKVQDEEIPQIAPQVSLPLSDEFRTSLILPNLSARFSMLRDQDDPFSKIGKASDDSVLQPKRQSRLPDFGFAGSKGLTDIAEVASVSSSARPPWLSRQHDSFVSDDSYGADNDSTHNGSVMNRARPGEGNVLFGGRQKVYKIASSKSTKSLTGDSSGMGKAVYEDDLSLSAFQKFKLAEKEAAAQKAMAEEAESSDSNSVPFGLASSTAAMAHSPQTQTTASPNPAHSPSMSNEQRQASIDSTATSERIHDRNSTPGTSVASQPFVSPSSNSFMTKAKTGNAAPLERSLTKRRLYEQSLDQSRQEQQVSALTRLNSIQKQRNFTGTTSPPPTLSQPKSASQLQNQERSFQPYAVRPQSPTEVLTTFDSIGMAQSISPSPPSSHPQSPTFIPLNEYDEMNPLSATLQPGDRGKATAMNAFQMPRQPFDEDQYLQRLQQMQQTSTSPVQETAPEEVKPSNSPQLTRFDSARQPSEDVPTPSAPRARSLSQPTHPDPPNAFSVFQRAAAQMRGEEHHELVEEEEEDPEENMPDTHRTFFGDISASDDDDDDILSDFDRRGYYGPGRFRPGELGNIEEHPGGRTPTAMFPEIKEEDEEEEYVAPPQPLRTFASKPSLADSAKGHPEPMKEEEEPILPAEAYQPDEQRRALGGLVHQHLRNTSNVSSAPSAAARDMSSNHLRNPSDQSSVYTNTIGHENSAPSLSDATSRFTERTYTSNNRLDSTYTNSNPWDLDDFDSSYYYGSPETNKPSVPTSAPQENRVLASAPSKANVDLTSQRNSESSTWQPDHKRDLSAGTLLEREAFEKEIAARQKAIQENLKSIVEVESQSRGSSPQPTQGGAFKAFNMLKTKSSRDSMVKPQEQPTKAMKMLGLGAGGSQTSLPISRKASAVNDEIKAPSDKFPSYTNSPRPSFSQRTPPMGDQKTRGMFDMQRPRGESEASLSRMPMNRPSPPSTSHGPQPRTRSNSQASSLRNQMRGDRFANDAERMPMEQNAIEGATSPVASSKAFSPHFSPNFSTGFSPQFSAQFSPQQSPNLSQGPAGTSEGGRMRSGSRSAMNSPIEPPMSMNQASMSQISMSQASMSNTSLSQASSVPQASMPPMPSSHSYRTMPASSSSAPPTATFKQGPMSVPSPRPSPMPSPYYANPTPPASGSSTPIAFGPATPTMPNIPNIKQGSSLLRKKTVSKSEISDPILISSTSNVDTVDLPPGASLRNGMEPPPIPPVNPRRRATKKLFGLGSKQEAETAPRYANPGSPPPIPTSAPRRMMSSERMMSPEPYLDRTMEQSYRSGSAQGHRPAPRAMRSNESFQERPSYPVQGVPQRPIMTEGGMF
ncbi:hypothetical protein C1H76_8714 [Elsinoe australis]|uniref:Uncharacterized protein n=1 Tax=Elsinoe australis TaxID=40998 RepID=A0A4U7AMW2_9PEZI|nr:hypothetical protein C1H76_8714 [Elsinoe australis]